MLLYLAIFLPFAKSASALASLVALKIYEEAKVSELVAS